MEKISVAEYRKYLEEYYYWEVDNDPKKLTERKKVIGKYSDERLLKIINDTYAFAKYLVKKLKSDNKILDDKIFTFIYVSGESELVINGCTGGHYADYLYEVEFDGITTFISKGVLKNIFGKIDIEDDYDIETHEDGDIVCEYPIPLINFSLDLDIFNKLYSELMENVSRELKS